MSLSTGHELRAFCFFCFAAFGRPPPEWDASCLASPWFHRHLCYLCAGNTVIKVLGRPDPLLCDALRHAHIMPGIPSNCTHVCQSFVRGYAGIMPPRYRVLGDPRHSGDRAAADAAYFFFVFLIFFGSVFGGCGAPREARIFLP